jgi:phosphatidylglycerol:prolipoprotein diacylglycerol transferase
MFPILFKIGPFTFYALWVAVIIAVVVSTQMFLKRAKYERLDLTFLLDHSLEALIGAVFFSRTVFFISNWGYFGPLNLLTFLKQVFIFWQPGFSFWGAVFGFSLALGLQFYRKQEPIMPWLNALMTPLFVGLLIGHFGQLLDGQGYGNETILPWGITFESTNVKYTVPVHPTQIYAMLVILGLLLGHKSLQKHFRALQNKSTWTLFMINVYSGARFLIEFFRGDDTLMIGPARIGHIVSLIVFVISGYFMYKNWGRASEAQA